MGKSGGRRKKSGTTAAPSVADTGQQVSSAAQDACAPDPLKRAHDLKNEGNRMFQSHDFAGALDAYERALCLLPDTHPDRAVFHSNRAACLLHTRPVDHEAVAAECSLALLHQPGYPRALLRRARAYEALGLHDLALRDSHALLASDPANSDALEMSRRLSSAPANNAQTNQPPLPPAAPIPSPAINNPAKSEKHFLSNGNVRKPGVVLKPMSSKTSTLIRPSYRDTNCSSESMKTGSVAVARQRHLKLVYGHDIRLAQMPHGCSFKQLREIVAKRFPSAKSVLVKFKDDDGDLVTITSSEELRLAEVSVEKASGEKDKGDGLRMLKLYVVEVSPEQEPLLAEDEEQKAVEDERVDSTSNSSAGGIVSERAAKNDTLIVKPSSSEYAKKELALKKDCGHPQCKGAEVDAWLFEFARLFCSRIGIFPDEHLDLHELGMDLCSEAMDGMVTSEEAQELLEMAASKFQEVVAIAFFNWGNVHMCAAKKRIPMNEYLPKEILAPQIQKAYDWIQSRYTLAEQKYLEALRIKPDFYEGLLAIGQQNFEAAKLKWNFALANNVDLSTWDSSEIFTLFDSAEDKTKAAIEMLEKDEERRNNDRNGSTTSKKDELIKKQGEESPSVEGEQDLTVEEEQSEVYWSQIRLFWGNMLFERSQIEFKLGIADWKNNLDAAIEKFKLAGASEYDVSDVLKSHASNGGSFKTDVRKIININDWYLY